MWFGMVVYEQPRWRETAAEGTEEEVGPVKIPASSFLLVETYLMRWFDGMDFKLSSDIFDKADDG